jgi:rhodanese-related sulfurtransferase
MTASIHAIPQKNYEYVRNALLERREIAFLDVREEGPHAEEHPLFAANLPLSRIEYDAHAKMPRRDVPIVTIDEGEGFAELAARRLIALGFTDVSVFAGGIRAWDAAGGELFRDVNVPSKSFGELVESKRHTPSLSAEEVKQRIDANEDMVVLDVRRFDEYNTMSIPTGINVPGAELVLRVKEIAPNPNTQIIVNCAGRTRSILGTQSLINAGIPNPVHALRNGTIGWKLAGQTLDVGQTRRFIDVQPETAAEAAKQARSVADRAKVKRSRLSDVKQWQQQGERTSYFFDTRTPEEYEAGHLPGFRSVPGGQLVQETEMVAPVRGARLVLADPSGVRADMAASWLAQMAWDVYVVDGLEAHDLTERGPWKNPVSPLPKVDYINAATLVGMQESNADVLAVDFSTHAFYVRGHIPCAWFALRSELTEALKSLPAAEHYVLTSTPPELAVFAAAEMETCSGKRVSVLQGGNAEWSKAGQKLTTSFWQSFWQPVFLLMPFWLLSF